MGDIAEQYRIERRRARRQQKILASAESRLNKIVGSQAVLRESASPSPSPSSSTTSLQEMTTPVKNTPAEHYPAPSDPRRQKYEDRLMTPRQQLHRPVVQKAIEEEEQANRLNEKGFLGGKIPHLLLAGMLRKTSPKPRRSSHPANKYWNLLHFICMAWLGILGVYEEWSVHGLSKVPDLIQRDTTATYFPVFWYFVIVETALQFGKSVYHPTYKSPEDAVFMDVASQLPEQLQHPAYLIQKYGTLANRIFRDLCIVIFVIGSTSLSLSIVL